MKLLCAILICLVSFAVQAEHKLAKDLKGDLVTADGKKSEADLSKKKYIVFYYSASWCGPCQKFTPELVKFYNESKKEDFEIVFVSNDRNEKEMMAYMKTKKMSFLAIDFKKAKMNKEINGFAGKGIPFIAVVDETGKAVIQDYSYRALDKLKNLVK